MSTRKNPEKFSRKALDFGSPSDYHWKCKEEAETNTEHGAIRMTTTTLTLTKVEMKTLKAEYKAVVKKLNADQPLTDSDRVTLDAYARATAQSWATYTGEVHYLARVGLYLIVMTKSDIIFRVRAALPRRAIVEKCEPVEGGWYATSLGTF
jgi:phage terminase small subunit